MIRASRYLLTTRPASKVSTKIVKNCFELINVPVTELKSKPGFDTKIINEFNPEIAVFTSSYGVDLYFDQYEGSFRKGVVFIAIGNETSNSLTKKGFNSIIPDIKNSNGVVELLDKKYARSMKVALFISSKSNGIIQEYLERTGRPHITTVLYDVVPVEGNTFLKMALQEDCFGIIVTSSYEARVIFGDLLNGNEKEILCRNRKIFAIGNPTAEQLRKLHITVTQPVGHSDLQQLVDEIEKKYCNQK